MPRRRLRRRISYRPRITRFTPIVPLGSSIEEVILTLDELEALRLKDLQGLDQDKAAEQMKISQPTFHRLILSARKKTADALVNNKQIRIQGGAYQMVEESMPPRAGRGRGRGGAGFRRGRGAGLGAGPVGFCVCPACGNKQEKVPGWPCSQMQCKKCGALMVRS